MGKYMKKTKPKTEKQLSLLDTNTYFGVRTRAKTLALRKSQFSSISGGSYLQLRSRRLHKPPISIPSHDSSSKRQKLQNPKSPIRNPSSGSRFGNGSVVASGELEKEEVKGIVHENVDAASVVEASCGENCLDFEGRERNTRESTPCSLIRNPDAIRTPGSTTRPTRSTDRRTEQTARRQFPTAHEMDEFFAEIEETQQRQFIENFNCRYNFNPVDDKPLPGRYEWEELKS
ncbi:PREDICTED: cyclin-dependent kinase inhibitor 4-like isoform X1 [Lupinus angustifolius]|uniref:cyclin-dependent kinase inhibitor 4-like isoform X1 n=1 Tax=Lupinus angustifolius TaxID=3871 RepID=UPI00092E42AA|nr:PREDICTED: cyclin-dependent kinase inhibitor 4-like isoform X1 [Lupinus angustifolius]